jgi:hypothetical protein
VPRKHCLAYPYFYNTIKREKELQTKLLGEAREESYQLKREKEETSTKKRERLAIWPDFDEFKES